MTVETATYLNDLQNSLPNGTDTKNEGDNHIRLIKAVLQNTFPGMSGRAWRVQEKTSSYNLVITDNCSIISINGTGLSITTSSAISSLGNGFSVVVFATGSDVTFNPNSTETINGASAQTVVIAGGTAAIITAGATTWTVMGLTPFSGNVATLGILGSGSINTGADYLLVSSSAVSGAARRVLVADLLGSMFAPGFILYNASASVPAGGWLPTDGAAVSRTTYSRLFAVIGTTYGAGNGSTTFNVPDTRGMVIASTGQGAGLSNRTLNQKAGAETHQLSINEMPSHDHGGGTNSASAVTTNSGLPTGTLGSQVGIAVTGTTSHAHTIPAQGGNAAHNNMQPTIFLNGYIKT